MRYSDMKIGDIYKESPYANYVVTRVRGYVHMLRNDGATSKYSTFNRVPTRLQKVAEYPTFQEAIASTLFNDVFETILMN